ncbi:MAG: DUF3450 domain-containing protein [Gammaproteobacteria bacterium]|nr:DUF3450 domain-containing protein [Gammaproteobacteria bacterium]
MHLPSRRLLIGCLFASAAIGVTSAAAQTATPDAAIDAAGAYQNTASQSQKRIESLDDQALAMLSEYNAEIERYEDLLTYNANLKALLASQQVEKQRISGELAGIETVRQEIVPLMVQMIEVLESFIELDQPLLLDERKARLKALQTNLTRSDVDLAEKYRRIIEAYQIEAEYGQSIEAYEGPIELDGRDLTVDFLRVGRVNLYYLTLDRNEGGIWDPANAEWRSLPERDLDDLDYALRVARKQAPPNLMQLPLWTSGEMP